MNDFLKEIEDEVLGKIIGTSQIHIRIQQRNARKRWTLVEGLGEDLDIKGILKVMRKRFSCNGSLQKDKESGATIIQLTGDQRKYMKKLLVDDMRIISVENLILHG